MRLVRLSAAVTAALLTFVAGIGAEPIPSGAIHVIDGNTISTRGQTVRLVGFDTPEAGINAACEAERTLAAKATGKLRQLVAGGGLDLSLVRCSCPPATEGTQACNYGAKGQTSPKLSQLSCPSAPRFPPGAAIAAAMKRLG